MDTLLKTGKNKILIVEDEGIVARDLSLSLRNLNYEVTGVVVSGEEALKHVMEEKPNLILMDIVLQGQMDGIEAAERIKRDFNLPVIYLTAYANEKVLDRAKITEPFGYLLKPFDDIELHFAIQMAIYKHKMEEEREKLIRELKDALAKIKTLSGLIPICAWCKKVRDDKGYWKQVEIYIKEHSDADFTHGMCPECQKKIEIENNLSREDVKGG